MQLAQGGGGRGMGVVCERHVDWGNGGVVVMKGEWNGLGHGRPGKKSAPPPLAVLDMGEVACHRAEKPPRLRAGMGILGGPSPTLVLCHLCVSSVCSTCGWELWVPWPLGCRFGWG